EGLMFVIGWCKCSMKNEKFGLYVSLGKIENTSDEWQNQGSNLSSVGFILGQSLQYVGDNLFEKIQNCYKSLGVLSFAQVKYEAKIPANQGVFEFASALTFTINGFKNTPQVDEDALLYALGWWFQADKRTSQIQRHGSKQCTGGKLIFPNENFWIDLSECHGLIQVVCASSTSFNYTDPAQDNKRTTQVGISVQCSRRFPILQKIAYAREGCQLFTCKSLCLYKLWTIQTSPYTGAGSRRLPRKSLRRAGSQQFKSCLTPVLASNNSHANPDACAGSPQFNQFLMPRQASDNSHVNPYACGGSQKFKQFLTPGQASNNSHVNPYACAGSNNAKNFLHLCRISTIHTQILTLVKVSDNSNDSINE
ncbi:hypothetical protein O181_106820, partial [Austropuccinia psidii MF-1]|nr:hypothetical protein [Austropuccinia psidii MF-1]